MREEKLREAEWNGREPEVNCSGQRPLGRELNPGKYHSPPATMPFILQSYHNGLVIVLAGCVSLHYY